MQRQLTLADALDLANHYREDGQFVAAEEICRNVIAAVPDSREAHFLLAQILLVQRRFAEGWAEYEWRPQVVTTPIPFVPNTQHLGSWAFTNSPPAR